MQLKKVLKNGQVAMLFKTEESCVLYPGKRLHYIDFVIEQDEATCLKWYKELHFPMGEIDTATTGNAGLEGMLFALQTIQELMKHVDKGDIFIVQPTDDRRNKAYRRLLKYGFRKEQNHYTYSL